MLSPSLTRKRILRCMGATALAPSATSTVLFVLDSISASLHNSPVTVVCIVSSITGTFNFLLLLLFTIYPLHNAFRYRLCGAISSFLAGVVAAITLGWLNIRKQDLPPNIVGQNSTTMVVAGFGVFIVTAIAQAAFWTTLVLSSNAAERRVILPRTHIRKPSKPIMEMRSPSPTLSPKQSYQSTIETKHSSIISQILPSVKSPTNSKHRSSHISEYISSISETVVTNHKITAHRSMEAEVNHFDAWETSDLTVQERVAASLAEVERETMAEQEAAQGLGITGNRRGSAGSVQSSVFSGIIRPVSTIYENDIQTTEIQRQGSPPLPENELTPRSFTFPTPIKAAMTSPRYQVRRGSRESGELRGATALGGTGKWLGSPRARESAEMAFVHHHPARI
ncbi:hypothetical protein EDC01DRAFT_630929 [Geopyxis carbonaria]|nr:hypothetical protein EDC01DRAFT_630929 [Geopyxis carbonaria]